jgi:hypothetical protein
MRYFGVFKKVLDEKREAVNQHPPSMHCYLRMINRLSAIG